MGIGITILMENRAGKGLAAEHGLSVLIEKEGRRVLLDTGQTGAFIDNAEKLGISVEPLDAFVLSHGHYDHAGGVARLLSVNTHVPVYAAPGYDKVRYSLKPDKPPRYIGISRENRHALQERPDRIRLCRKPTEIAPGIVLSGPIPRSSRFEDTGGPFYEDKEGRCPDGIEDDQALWLETDKGLLVVTGCAHAGIINTLQYARQQSGVERVHGILGGFHLVNADENRLQQTLAELHQLKPAFLAPCHCTGEKALEHLKTHFPEAFHEALAGSGFCFQSPSLQRRANIGD